MSWIMIILLVILTIIAFSYGPLVGLVWLIFLVLAGQIRA